MFIKTRIRTKLRCLYTENKIFKIYIHEYIPSREMDFCKTSHVTIKMWYYFVIFIFILPYYKRFEISTNGRPVKRKKRKRREVQKEEWTAREKKGKRGGRKSKGVKKGVDYTSTFTTRYSSYSIICIPLYYAPLCRHRV